MFEFGNDALLIGLVVIFVRFVLQDFSRALARLMDRRAFIRALYAEIDHNTRDLESATEKSFDATYDTAMLREKLHDDDFRPYMKFTPHTAVYKRNLDHLHGLNNELIQLVINMYSRFDSIIADCDGVLQINYKTLSVDSQYMILLDIFEESVMCRDIGQKILKIMEKRYSWRGLNLERYEVCSTYNVSPPSRDLAGDNKSTSS